MKKNKFQCYITNHGENFNFVADFRLNRHLHTLTYQINSALRT